MSNATGGKTRLWHPWQEQQGMHHKLSYWEDGNIFRGKKLYASPRCANDAIELVGRRQLYVLCNDILSVDEFPFSKELVLHDKAEPFLSKSGRVVALRAHPGRASGYFIPASSWGNLPPGRELNAIMWHIFRRFYLEAITPPSLSEKVLRLTLPDKVFIRRPPSDLRSVLLEHNGGGRIDEAEEWGEYFAEIFEYDLTKAYLHFSRWIPSPFVHAWGRYKPPIDVLDRYPAGFWQVSMVAHGEGVHPVYIDIQKGKKHKPREGEEFCMWLWSGTIKDCLEKGYTLLAIHRGYGFPEMSDFLSVWADWLWDVYNQETDDRIKAVLKQMMVGLPGRFLKEPMCYTLIYGTPQKGDKPIAANWQDSKGPFFSDWYVRPTFNRESTALTAQGSYIIEECRRAQYHRMRDEYEHGNRIIRSYIDCYAITQRTTLDVGRGRGQYKERIFTDVYAELNRFVGIPPGEQLPEMRAPGLEGNSKARLELWRKYRQRTSFD